MNAFAVIVNWDQSPANRAALEYVLARLDHRNSDGVDILVYDPVALGHQHFWVTPEEKGERQPLSDGKLVIVFDGRLDNREDLLKSLEISAPNKGGLSDAALVMSAYQRWGEKSVEHLQGAFAFAIYNRSERSVYCGRDRLGNRTLFYHAGPGVLVIASEPYAILAHPGVNDGLDETTIAYYFASQSISDGSTFFEDVKELLPASALLAKDGKVHSWRYWDGDPELRIHYNSDEEYAEHFLELLSASIRRRMRSQTPIAIMMSGGLDSTSVAAISTHELASRRNGHKLHTISYVYDELASCDEREYILPMVDHIGAQAVFVPGDDAWPLHNWEKIAVNPNTPLENPYRNLSDRVYQAARKSGIRTLLSGIFGDNIYGGMEYWLLDLLSERRFAEAGWDVLKHLPHQGLWEVINSRSLRVVGGRILDAIPGGRVLHPIRPAATPEWLTPLAATRINSSEVWPPNADKARRPGQFQRLLGTFIPQEVSTERFHTNRAGVEMCYPYRDLELVQFMLSIPAHQLYNKGWYKYILRNAMQDILPEKVRLREFPTSVRPLFERGLAEKERDSVREILLRPEATWSDFVKSDWVDARLRGETLKHIKGLEQIIIWRCISFEIWQNSLVIDKKDHFDYNREWRKAVMSDSREPIQSINTSANPNLDDKEIRRYSTPHLWAFGDLRDLTLGGTPGTGDSGDPGAKNQPTLGGRYQDIA